MPLPDAIRLATDILRGLEYLHGHGFFHNDVKPGNVLIGPQNQGMLTDYGIVAVATVGGTVAPSTFYKIHAAPEVVSSNSISAQTEMCFKQDSHSSECLSELMCFVTNSPLLRSRTITMPLLVIDLYRLRISPRSCRRVSGGLFSRRFDRKRLVDSGPRWTCGED